MRKRKADNFTFVNWVATTDKVVSCFTCRHYEHPKKRNPRCKHLFGLVRAFKDEAEAKSVACGSHNKEFTNGC